ncbi:outer dynein arm-docking complex subunit 2-like [Bacillus rossius redtenbacheri]|uniref:outer dynein arm-docking complex subunit 2-like n=1 Tax=Bacillus rossius redtenbacheri TaxID=93214 RepID=UPI002FDD03CD
MVDSEALEPLELRNVVGALAECCRLEELRPEVRQLRGLAPLVLLLTAIDDSVLREVAAVLGRCSKERETALAVDALDGVRLLWSLVRSVQPATQRNAAQALCPFIVHVKNSDHLVRSIVGGLDSIMELLDSPHTEVVEAACEVIALIAMSATNLNILTDYGVIPMLARFVDTEDRGLRRRLADAIGSCCHYKDNCLELGRLGVIPPLVGYLREGDVDTKRAAAGALRHLSTDAFNCITMHHHGVVPLLLHTIGSPDRPLQEASAGCLRNIRKLALSADKRRRARRH